MDKEHRIIVVNDSDDVSPVEAPTPTSIQELTLENAASVEPSDTTQASEPITDQSVVAEEFPLMPDADNSTTVPPQNQPSVADEAPVTVAPSPAKKPRRKKYVLIGAAASVILLAGGAATALLIVPTKTPVQSNASVEQPQTKIAKMGVAVTLVDGEAEYSIDEEGWQPLTTNSQLAEGNYVRTSDSRVVLTLDDGSALRLDANTAVRLESLTAANVKIAHTAGTTYSRVVPSERSYSVVVGDAQYTAMGTAFATSNDAEEKGVQVYQSSVKVEGVQTAVAEGRQYYSVSNDPARKDKITDLNLDSAAESEFLQWNLGEDEKQQQFKEKLGVLLQVRQRAEDKIKQTQAEAAKRLQEQEAAALKAKQDAERKAQEKNASAGAQTSSLLTRGALTAEASRTSISWSYTGKAVYGYKLVYSRLNPLPTFGVDGAVYYGDQNSTTGSLPKEAPKGTYKVRVCAYTAGRESEPCVDYSNVVTIVKS